MFLAQHLFVILAENAVDGNILYLTFLSPFDEVSREYYIYNFGRIAAAVGGAAMLLLGISLFQVMAWIIDTGARRIRINNAKEPLRSKEEIKNAV